MLVLVDLHRFRAYHHRGCVVPAAAVSKDVPRDGMGSVSIGSTVRDSCGLGKLCFTAHGIAVVFGYAVCVKNHEGILGNREHVVCCMMVRKNAERQICRPLG